MAYGAYWKDQVPDIRLQPTDLTLMPSGVSKYIANHSEGDHMPPVLDAFNPLSFDRAMQGQPIQATDSPLLTLPIELINTIARLLGKDDLASLAFVNSDCRQLARSRQFANIYITTYCEVMTSRVSRSQRLIECIATQAREAQEELKTRCAAGQRGRASRLLTIGACVRRLCVNSFEVDRDSTWGPHTFRYLTKAMAAAMPNLELVAWKHGYALVGSDFFNGLLRSRARHLFIGNMRVDHGFTVGPPDGPMAVPLTSLWFEVQKSYDSIWNEERWWEQESEQEERDRGGWETWEIAPFCESVLRLCAPTLERLVWKLNKVFAFSERLRFSDQPLLLPNLRMLRLADVRLAPSTLAAFMKAPQLRHLEIDDFNDFDWQSLGQTLPALDTLVLRRIRKWAPEDIWAPEEAQTDKGRYLKYQPMAAFVQRHARQLRLLHVACDYMYGPRPDFIDSYLVPALAATPDHYANLTSLSLVWGSKDIADVPEPALAAVASLTNLEQLRLSCLGDASSYLPSVPTTWAYLGPSVDRFNGRLPRLARLAFAGLFFGPAFYANRRNPGEVSEEDEKNHADDMRTIAEVYASALPALEWLCIGGWLFRFAEAAEAAEKAERGGFFKSFPSLPVPELRMPDGRRSERVAIPLKKDDDPTSGNGIDAMFKGRVIPTSRFE